MSRVGSLWERAAHAVAEKSGRPFAFAIALLAIIVWLVSGPLFGFSDTWQLVVNTATTITTFLMVFLIQHAQNKEARAMELKLNELIAAVHGASNRLIDIETLSENEIVDLHHRYDRVAEAARRRESGPHETVAAAPPLRATRPPPQRARRRRAVGARG